MELSPYIYQCPVFEDWHDPLTVRRKLYLLSNGEINAWLKQGQSEHPGEVFAAHELLLPVVREAFALPPIDRENGTGVSDEQALDVLNHYLRWLEGKV